MSGRPNIVVVMADDMGFGDIGFFGNPDVVTPNINALAAGGIALTSHYSASPMCAPARAAFLTGKYPHRTGAVDVATCRGLDRIAPDERLLSQDLKALGYTTDLVGKWHSGRDAAVFHPLERGFDEFCGFRSGGCDYYDWVIEDDGRSVFADGRYLTDVFTDRACLFAQEHSDVPFFLWLAYNAPHMPLEAPAEYIEKYTALGKYNIAVCTLYAMIEIMDEGIGRLVNALKRAGVYDNTLIIITCDNGPCFRGKGEASQVRFNGVYRGSKGDVLEGGIRVPAIASWPGVINAGGISDAYMHFTDWRATLVNAAGGSLDTAALDGESRLNMLRTGCAANSPDGFWQWNRYTPAFGCNAAVREGDFKLCYPPIEAAMDICKADGGLGGRIMARPDLCYSIKGDPVERDVSAIKAPVLFNVKDDPGETKELSAQYPELYARLKQRLDAWQCDMAAQWTQACEKTIGGFAQAYTRELSHACGSQTESHNE